MARRRLPCSFIGMRWVRAAAALAAAAVWSAQAQPGAQRIEIIGVLQHRLGGPSAGPVTVLRAEDLARSGVTTAAEALQRLASHQSTKGLAQAVGESTGGQSEADLRGLGEDKTLVLLDGRRIAAHAYHGAAVDLNAIPLAAIERIEVRRDALGVLYGSGAVVGVVDFILKREVDGVALALDASRPQHRGGSSARASVVAGHGSLATDGRALLLAADVRRQSALPARARSFARSGIVRNAAGDVIHAATSDTSFPGDLDGFEPSLDAGCAPPRSVPDEEGTACRYDFMRDLDLAPRNRQATLLAAAAWAGPAGTTLRAQWLRAENRVRSTVAPAPATMVLPASSPFWIDGRPARAIAGFPDGGIVDWRITPAGRRVDETRAVAQRALAAVEGKATEGQGWDWQAALLHSTSRVADRLVAGHVDRARIQQGLLDGVIDPFGAPSAAGQAALDAARVRGPLARARGQMTGVDLRATRRWPAADAAPAPQLQIAVEAWRERFAFDVLPNAARTAAGGLELASDTHGARNAQAIAAAWTQPWTPAFDTTLGLRADHVGTDLRRASPTLGARWRVSPAWQWRASAGGGFRAPTLYEVHAPAQLDATSDSFDDPLLCPGGVPVAGVPAGAVCAQQVLARSGGPAAAGRSASSLKAETGRTATLGFVADPAPRTTLSIDAWWARLRGGIDTLSVDTIFDDPERHAGRIVRCGNLDAATRSSVAACAPYPAFDPIAWVLTPNENLVDTDARGVDLAFTWRSEPRAWGEVALSLEASYVLRHRTRIGGGGAFFDSVGRFAEDNPIFRLQTSAQATWTRGPWSASVAHRRKSGYVDQSGERRVRPYTLVDASIAYTPTPGLTLSLGVANLFDRAPPFSDQAETPQANYDPRFTDPLGRALTLRAAWEWR
jgi:iron complex outermembrane receptor protein